MATAPAFSRILLKLSGESLAPAEGRDIIDIQIVQRLARDIQEVHDLGVEIALVLGSGNIWRGTHPTSSKISVPSMDHATSDYMGILGDVINALALQDAMEKIGLITRVQTAIEMPQVAEPFIRRRAIRHLEKGRIVILAGGSGHPYFTHDMAAALRALELNAQVLLKGTRVDGIYTADPEKDSNATKFETLDYMQALNMGAKVMDSTAIALCKENHMPVIVFNMNEPGSLRAIIQGERKGTKMHTHA